MAKGIKFKDTIAMPGSSLHEHIKGGDSKKTEEAYRSAQEMHRRHVTKEQDEMLIQLKENLRLEHQTLNEQRKARNGC